MVLATPLTSSRTFKTYVVVPEGLFLFHWKAIEGGTFEKTVAFEGEVNIGGFTVVAVMLTGPSQ